MGIFDRKPNVEKLKARKNMKGLIKTLKYNDHYVRGFAADALGEIGDSRAVEPLINALKDPFSDVQYYATRALGEIGDKRAVEPLTKALKYKDSGVRMRAAEALEMIAWQPKDDVEKAYYLIAKK